jgi:hypothetical protein
MTIYDEMKAVGAELLGEFKQGSIKIIQIVAGTGPDDNPGESVETSYTLDATVRGAPFKYIRDGFVT